MSVYVFASDNRTNIWAGVGAQLWAVGLGNNPTTAKVRGTKAKSIQRGDLGLFYSTEDSAFTTPFIFLSPPSPDLDETISEIWKGTWHFPFRLRTLGTPYKLLSRANARAVLPSCVGGQKLEKLVSVSATTIFSPTKLTLDDWAEMIKVLAD